MVSKLLVEKNHAPLLVEKTSTNWHQVPRAIPGTVCESVKISALKKLMCYLLKPNLEAPFSKRK